MIERILTWGNESSLVHVTGVCPVDNRLMFSEFGLADSSLKRRELVFESGQSGFLTGDLVHEFIQQESMCLLRDLLLAARQDTSVSALNQHIVFFQLTCGIGDKERHHLCSL